MILHLSLQEDMNVHKNGINREVLQPEFRNFLSDGDPIWQYMHGNTLSWSHLNVFEDTSPSRSKITSMIRKKEAIAPKQILKNGKKFSEFNKPIEGKFK